MRLDDIEKVYKKRKHDKDSRLATVLVRILRSPSHLLPTFFFFLTLPDPIGRVSIISFGSLSLQEGRADREKPTRKPKRQNPFASTTNREKTKSKNFMMLKQKAKGKKKRSFKDKQVSSLSLFLVL